MATEEENQRAIKNYERALTLTVDAPIEKIKALYSEWAVDYDKVNMDACISPRAILPLDIQMIRMIVVLFRGCNQRFGIF